MRNLFVGACLYAAAFGAAALSLGASRGAVVLGSTIDLAFEVQPDPGRTLASSCISARLVSGTTAIAEPRIHVTPVEDGPTPLVHVQAFVAVDEPVLTATLMAGCEGRVTRTYTFLADLPPTAPAVAQGPIDIARLGAEGPQRSQSGAQGVSAATVSSPARAEPPRRRPAARAPAPVGEAAGPLARAGKPPAPARQPQAGKQARKPKDAPAPAAAPSRLVMEPLDLWPETPPALRLTREQPQMSAQPTEAQRGESAALWQALNTSPADVQRFESRLDKLEADAAAQRAQVEMERAVAAELRQRLARMESQSFSATVVYGLVGLLLLALGCIAWLLRRTRRQVLEAWQHSVVLSEGRKDDVVLSEGPDGEAGSDAHGFWEHTAQQPAHAVAADAAAVQEPAPAAAAPAAAAPVAVPAVPQAPVAPPARTQQIVQPEALFDILQQAEFFISVGEHEQAIEVLRKHIAEHGDASPLAHLELLRLFHTLGRTESFDQLREQFHERFNARVPGFAQFHQPGRGLEDYPEVLAQIEALWSSPEVAGVLDKFLFHRGDAQGAEPFDLAAFDDLLLLLSIVQTTPAHLRGAPPPRARTTPRAQDRAAPAARSLDSMAAGLSLLPSGYAPLARQPADEPMLDVDLSEPPHITISDLPPMPVTAAPAPGQPVGFGMENDKLEARFELEEQEKKRR